MESFGSRLRIFRESKKLNQDKFSEICGLDDNGLLIVSQQNLTQWERDLSKPSSKKMKAIEMAFKDLNYDWLESGKGEMLKQSIQAVLQFEERKIDKDLELLKEENKELKRHIQELRELLDYVRKDRK